MESHSRSPTSGTPDGLGVPQFCVSSLPTKGRMKPSVWVFAYSRMKRHGKVCNGEGVLSPGSRRSCLESHRGPAQLRSIAGLLLRLDSGFYLIKYWRDFVLSFHGLSTAVKSL